MKNPYQNKNWQKPLTSGNCLVANVLLDGVNSNLHLKKNQIPVFKTRMPLKIIDF